MAGRVAAVLDRLRRDRAERQGVESRRALRALEREPARTGPHHRPRRPVAAPAPKRSERVRWQDAADDLLRELGAAGRAGLASSALLRKKNARRCAVCILEDDGFVVFDDETRRWRLTPLGLAEYRVLTDGADLEHNTP